MVFTSSPDGTLVSHEVLSDHGTRNWTQTLRVGESHFVPLLQNLIRVCVERHKLVGVFNPDWSSAFIHLHPLWRQKQEKETSISVNVPFPVQPLDGGVSSGLSRSS